MPELKNSEIPGVTVPALPNEGTDVPKKGKPRKARADKGKGREPYGPRTVSAEQMETVPSPVQQDAPVATLDQVMAAMEKLFAVPDGMQKCTDALARSGVTRIRDLKPEAYGALVQDVERIISGGAA
jgi:hypothetical protein